MESMNVSDSFIHGHYNSNNNTNNTTGWGLLCTRLCVHHLINSHNHILR